MLSFHAASIIASCVRTEYPAQSGAQDIPKTSPRIRGPDNKNNADRLWSDMVSVEIPPRASPSFKQADYVWYANHGNKGQLMPLGKLPVGDTVGSIEDLWFVNDCD